MLDLSSLRSLIGIPFKQDSYDMHDHHVYFRNGQETICMFSHHFLSTRDDHAQ